MYRVGTYISTVVCALDSKRCHHSQSRHIYKVPYNRLLHNLMSVLLLPLKARREMHSSVRELTKWTIRKIR